LRARLEGNRMMTRQLAHEIKNPLGGVRGAAQLLARQLPDPELREYTSVIINEADRLTALVDIMTSPARPPQKITLNVHEVCEHVHRLLAAEAPADVLVERDYDPSIPDGSLAMLCRRWGRRAASCCVRASSRRPISVQCDIDSPCASTFWTMARAFPKKSVALFFIRS
jgi:signal transduction histidine kinase